MQTSSVDKRISAARLPHRERVRRISALIRLAERRLLNRFAILRHQNAIGLGIFLGAAGGIVASGLLYLFGLLPAWAVVVLCALCVSLLHELEHDLIHQLYFKTRPRVQNFMMFGVWFFRPNFPSPWYRRKVHLWHHKASGQASDMEERYLGNGMRYDWRRALAMLDTFFSVALRHRELARIPGHRRRKASGFDLRLMGVFYTIWFVFLASLVLRGCAHIFGFALPEFMTTALGALDFTMVVWILPCSLTRASISIVSSSLHYYGDVDELLQQTQVFTPWYLAPFQLFCFNFGSTHAIHHIVVNQPFYMRQLVAPLAHAGMRRYGVRFNDTGTFRRANRYDLNYAA